MAKKSYSRQAMQKLLQQDIQAVSAGGSLRILSFQIPEEIVIKRIVLNVVQTTTSGNVSDGAFIASVCQNDSFNPDAGDSLDANRLVRSVCGNGVSPANLDHTITMRKLAGSGISVEIQNAGSSSESYLAKLTLHYLEV